MIKKQVPDDSSEGRIKQAAIKVFMNKGLSGARTQDIADEAGVNKAMLHYYFRNKQKLFEIVFAEKLQELFSAFGVILRSDLSFEQKIRAFVKKQTEMVQEFPELPMFVLNEVHNQPDMLDTMFAQGGPRFLKGLFQQLIQDEIVAGRIRPVSFEHFMINLMGLCMYPVLAKPIIQFMLDKDEVAFAQLLTDRQSIIADLILNDILI